MNDINLVRDDAFVDAGTFAEPATIPPTEIHDLALLDLLAARGIDIDAQQITLMRHKDRRYPLFKYIGTHALNLYQAMQPRAMPVGSLLLACYGHKAGHGLLLGLWRVRGVMPAGEAIQQGLTQGSFEPQDPTWPGYFHDLEELDLIDDLRLKVEIVWSGRELAWRRILKRTAPAQKAPFPARMRGEPAVPFESLTGVSLVMSELRLALGDPIWQKHLAGVSGVYLMTDERGGQHYIGSASGAGGLHGRWCNYASCGHGGNKLLVELLATVPGRELDFRFTLLEALPADTPRREVVRRESFWKVALGSRTFGLNAN